MVGELPSERCPRCDSRRRPLEWARDLGADLVTVWKCADCGATWSQLGRQESLFEPGAGAGELTLL